MDHVVSALPGHALAPLLGDPADRSVAAAASAVPTVDVGIVNVVYPSRCLPVTGFGYLVPSWEPAAELGVVFDSDAFPEQNRCARGRRRTGAHRAGGSLARAAATACTRTGIHSFPDQTRVTVMLGGHQFLAKFGDPATVTPATLEAAALTALREVRGRP